MQQQTEALYLNNRGRARLVLNTNLLKVLHEKAILQIIYIQPEYVVKQ